MVFSQPKKLFDDFQDSRLKKMLTKNRSSRLVYFSVADTLHVMRANSEKG